MAEEVMEKLDKQLSLNLRKTPLIESVNLALLRYSQTKNVQNVSDSIKSSLEMLSTKQDSENSMIRYLIWAIPSVGFIGTVRGIGLALSNADQALQGNISLMTENLGIAFNSTFVALIISLILMLLFHHLQKLQDENLINIQKYCEKYLYSKFT
jgi:biopolymer transport protein ExbB/TolQ